MLAALFPLFKSDIRARNPAEAEEVVHSHRKIVRAIAAGSADEAHAAMYAVILAGRQGLVSASKT